MVAEELQSGLSSCGLPIHGCLNRPYSLWPNRKGQPCPKATCWKRPGASPAATRRAAKESSLFRRCMFAAGAGLTGLCWLASFFLL